MHQIHRRKTIYKSLIIGLLFQMLFIHATMAQRDLLKWPFSKTSIWNMPIHKNATYVHAHIAAAANGFYADEEVIILKPKEIKTAIYENFADWDASKDRCIKQGKLLFSAPIPASFVYSKNEWKGTTPNSGLAVLMDDGITLKQTQPFARCQAGTDATSHYTFPDQTLTGDGIRGAHGGSGLSTLGGTIRLGELVPGGEIRHALKVDIYGAMNIFYDKATGGYRWPAVTADNYAASSYGTKRKPEPECCMGALLALPPSIDINQLGLQTEPAKILAKAFQNYGAYLVDDSAWDAYNICTEHGPDGTVLNEFHKVWGFPFESGKGKTFANDMEKIFTNLHVVTNNTATTIGGGPVTDESNRLAPVAPNYSVSAIQSSGLPTNSVIIYPNPTKDIVTIDLQDNCFTEISVFDTVGKLAFRKALEPDSENMTLDIKGWNKGIYFISLHHKNWISNSKLVID